MPCWVPDIPSRPNVPVNVLVSLDALKAGHGWSDEELYDHFLYDLQVRYALGYAGLSDGDFELRTLGAAPPARGGVADEPDPQPTAPSPCVSTRRPEGRGIGRMWMRARPRAVVRHESRVFHVAGRERQSRAAVEVTAHFLGCVRIRAEGDRHPVGPQRPEDGQVRIYLAHRHASDRPC